MLIKSAPRRVMTIALLSALLTSGISSSAFAVSPTSEPTKKPVPTTSILVKAVPSYKELLKKTEESFAPLVEKATARTTSSISTANLIALKTVVDEKIDFSKEPLAGAMRLVITGEPLTYDLYESMAASLAEEALVRTTELETAVVAWETELAAENARIEAERKRQEAEAAAKRAAEEAANARSRQTSNSGNSGSSNQSYSPPANNNGGESTQARLNRVAASLGFVGIPVVLNNDCGAYTGVALACYTVGSSTIKVTSGGFARNDCTLRRLIAHEHRHYQQNNSGQIQRDAAGNVTNRDWLESDARAFASRYGC